MFSTDFYMHLVVMSLLQLRKHDLKSGAALYIEPFGCFVIDIFVSCFFRIYKFEL